MMRQKPEITLVDLDRTIFDTTTFLDDLWNFLEVTYGVDSRVEREKAPLYYRFVNEWYDYDFFRHMSNIQSIPSDKALLIAAAKQVLRPSYLFADAHEVLDDCDEIITFGNESYQSFKLMFCPTFNRKPVRYISEEKGEYIAREFKDRTVLLVDDKDLRQTLPASAWFIRINRQQHKDCIINGPGTATISTLKKFTDARATLLDLS